MDGRIILTFALVSLIASSGLPAAGAADAPCGNWSACRDVTRDATTSVVISAQNITVAARANVTDAGVPYYANYDPYVERLADFTFHQAHWGIDTSVDKADEVVYFTAYFAVDVVCSFMPEACEWGPGGPPRLP
jgi:hypothetical protein